MERYQFGDFEFDSESRVLTRRGREVNLQAQPAIVLAVLLARRDQTVSRNDLKSAIWGTETHVDFDKGLNFCIAQIRMALRDDASRPLYIQTVPKVGYRFMAPVREIHRPAEDLAATEAVPPIPSVRLRPLMLGSIVTLAIGVIAVVLLLTRTHAAPNVAVVHFDSDSDAPGPRALADELSDDVTVRLTAASQGHFNVIGNAKVLRGPRDQRDLRAIASSLNCKYAVLGQVKTDGHRVLVLAHLIRLSDLTHIWVVRFERATDDPATVESAAAADIASQFAASMNKRPDEAASFSASGR